VVASLAAEFDPGDLRSDYRERLRTFLEAKAAGQEIATPEIIPDVVIDLMEALRRSVAEARELPKQRKRSTRRKEPSDA